MKSKNVICEELTKIRSFLAAKRAVNSDNTEMLYGAQQALGWVLDELRAPSEVEAAIEQIAKSLVL